MALKLASRSRGPAFGILWFGFVTGLVGDGWRLAKNGSTGLPLIKASLICWPGLVFWRDGSRLLVWRAAFEGIIAADWRTSQTPIVRTISRERKRNSRLEAIDEMIIRGNRLFGDWA